jgi:hypothetical protein
MSNGREIRIDERGPCTYCDQHFFVAEAMQFAELCRQRQSPELEWIDVLGLANVLLPGGEGTKGRWSVEECAVEPRLPWEMR